jgi:hypothetical protein
MTQCWGKLRRGQSWEFWENCPRFRVELQSVAVRDSRPLEGLVCGEVEASRIPVAKRRASLTLTFMSLGMSLCCATFGHTVPIHSHQNHCDYLHRTPFLDHSHFLATELKTTSVWTTPREGRPSAHVSIRRSQNQNAPLDLIAAQGLLRQQDK